MKWSFCLVLACLAAPSKSQVVVHADAAMLQPTVSRDEKGFKACGVRVVLTLINEHSKTANIYDFSLNIYGEGVSGLVKAGRYVAPFPLPEKWDITKATLPAPVGFWIAASAEGAMTTPKKMMPAESSGFILGLTPFDSTARHIFDIASGRKMQVAIRARDEKVDQAISFSKTMVPDDFEALQNCTKGLTERMQRDFDDEKENTGQERSPSR